MDIRSKKKVVERAQEKADSEQLKIKEEFLEELKEKKLIDEDLTNKDTNEVSVK